MSNLAKLTVQIITICMLFCSVLLSGCSGGVSDEIARKDFERVGGTELILEVDMVDVIGGELENLKDTVRQEFRERDRLRTEIIRVDDGAILIRLRKSEDMPRAMEIVENLNSEFSTASLFSGEALSTSAIGEKKFRLAFTQDYIAYTQKRLTEQSVNVIRKRNKTINRPRWWATLLNDDQIRVRIPSSLEVDSVKQNLQTQANLSFHMVRDESNNVAAMDLAQKRGIVPPGGVYYPEANGQGGLIVERRSQVTGQCLKSASEGVNPSNGYPVINFTFDIYCAKLFGQLTQRNIGKRFAVVLDGIIITAPRINGAILGGSGFIEGDFTLKSAKELAHLLNSGPLPARFKIIKETTIKPKT